MVRSNLALTFLSLSSCKLTRLRRLRVHATQEWHDLYQKETNDELQKFLDRYTKDIDNGWEETPKVRVSIYQYNKVKFPGCVVAKAAINHPTED
jgi:hypothetical protein